MPARAVPVPTRELSPTEEDHRWHYGQRRWNTTVPEKKILRPLKGSQLPRRKRKDAQQQEGYPQMQTSRGVEEEQEQHQG